MDGGPCTVGGSLSVRHRDGTRPGAPSRKRSACGTAGSRLRTSGTDATVPPNVRTVLTTVDQLALVSCRRF
jgi:hypothetical protein